MLYNKLKRTWSHSSLNHVPRLKEVFPELSKLNNEQLCDRFIELGLDFYTEDKVAVKWWIRLTLPLAAIAMLTMMIILPITFIVTGTWGYSLTTKSRTLNWFKALKILSN